MAPLSWTKPLDVSNKDLAGVCVGATISHRDNPFDGVVQARQASGVTCVVHHTAPWSKNHQKLRSYNTWLLNTCGAKTRGEGWVFKWERKFTLAKKYLP
jgi:hypothetical protein